MPTLVRSPAVTSLGLRTLDCMEAELVTKKIRGSSSAGVPGQAEGFRWKDTTMDNGANWTDDRVERLKKLYLVRGVEREPDRGPARRRQRNTVIGKVHRLNLPGAPETGGAASTPIPEARVGSGTVPSGKLRAAHDHHAVAVRRARRC